MVKKRVNLNRRDSRACPSPYTRKKDPITAPARNNNWAQSDFNSAEEYPFASSLQGGTGYVAICSLEPSFQAVS